MGDGWGWNPQPTGLRLGRRAGDCGLWKAQSLNPTEKNEPLTWYSHRAENPVFVVIVLSRRARLVSRLLLPGAPALSVFQTAGALRAAAADRRVRLLPRAVDEPLPLPAGERRADGEVRVGPRRARQAPPAHIGYLADQHPSRHGEPGAGGEVRRDHDPQAGLGEGQLVGVADEELVHHDGWGRLLAVDLAWRRVRLQSSVFSRKLLFKESL